MKSDREVREQLARHIEGGLAFIPLKKMLKEVPFQKVGERPADLPYSVYELFYHITYAQKDILKYCKEDSYEAPDWPQDYWPETKAPESEKDWESLKDEYFQDRDDFISFLMNEENGLVAPVKKGTDHTLLREALLILEHTSYHTGQLLVLLRLLDTYDG